MYSSESLVLNPMPNFLGKVIKNPLFPKYILLQSKGYQINLRLATHSAVSLAVEITGSRVLCN
jgi:hypothetical protein